ncbi:hypothetical protein ACS0TY_017498 [Phlomoides rotata]
MWLLSERRLLPRRMISLFLVKNSLLRSLSLRLKRFISCRFVSIFELCDFVVMILRWCSILSCIDGPLRSEDPARFWSDIASEFYWKHKWGTPVCSENFDVRKGIINIEWFKGGITNICYNCLDRNIAAGNGEKTDILWEGDDL